MKDDAIAEAIQDRYNGDINSFDKNHYSLVHIAFFQNDFERIDYLSKRRNYMDLKDKSGHSVLMISFLSRVDLQVLNFLIKCGSNISTTDNNNNTILHHLLFQKNPHKDVFKFVIEKRINYNIENNERQFPISIAIENSHDKFGFYLLNMNCKIHDQKSIHEPIVEALKRNGSKWFEELDNHGADAMNEKVGAISRYINSTFFNYNIFKKIKRMNIFLEAPLQMAIYKRLQNFAFDIWNIAVEQNETYKIAAKADYQGRILLSAAITVENKDFVDILLSNNYECEKPIFIFILIK